MGLRVKLSRLDERSRDVYVMAIDLERKTFLEISARLLVSRTGELEWWALAALFSERIYTRKS